MRAYQMLMIVFLVVVTTVVTARLKADGRADRQTQVMSVFDRVIENKTLRCAYVLYPPYFDMDPNTKIPHGIMVDLMKEAGKKLNISVQWTEEVGWGSMIEGLKTGRYDAVCSSVWQNAARSVQADFSTPIGYATVDAWGRADSQYTMADFNDVNIKVSTIDGEMSDMIAKNMFPKAQRVSLPQNAPFSDVLLQVVTGKADVAFVEPKIAADFLKVHPGSLKNLTKGDPVATYPITLMLPRGDVELRSMIDGALTEIIYTHGLDTILKENNVDPDLFLLPAIPFRM